MGHWARDPCLAATGHGFSRHCSAAAPSQNERWPFGPRSPNERRRHRGSAARRSFGVVVSAPLLAEGCVARARGHRPVHRTVRRTAALHVRATRRYRIATHRPRRRALVAGARAVPAVGFHCASGAQLDAADSGRESGKRRGRRAAAPIRVHAVRAARRSHGEPCGTRGGVGPTSHTMFPPGLGRRRWRWAGRTRDEARPPPRLRRFQPTTGSSGGDCLRRATRTKVWR